MRLEFVFLISFFLMGLIGSVSVASYFFCVSGDFLKERVDDNLESIALAHSQHISTYLEEKMDRVLDFGHDAFIVSRIREIEDGGCVEEDMVAISEHIIEHETLKEDEFYEVFILNKEGMVIGATNLRKNFGEDFSESSFFIEGKESSYVGDFAYDEEFKREGLVMSSPIFDDDGFLGMVVFRLSIDHLTGLVRNMKSFDEANLLGVGEFGDIYLVNRDRFLITPSRFLGGDTKGVLLQQVDSPNMWNCFDMDQNGEHKGHEKVISFVDFKGEDAIGSHEIIPLTNWCLLVEVNKNEMVDGPRRDMLMDFVIFFAGFIFIFSLIGYLIGKMVDRNRK